MVTVVQADAVSLPLPNRPFRVVANPPYGITADLLDSLLAAGTRLVAADLVLQRAVVRKHARDKPKAYRMSTGLVLPATPSARRPGSTLPCSSSAGAS
jgi:23S rRNA (adenine-N6)-dimethyltransferase